MKKTLSAFAITLGLLATDSAFAQKISYEVAVPEPHTHYCEVKVTVEDAKKKHRFYLADLGTGFLLDKRIF
jgi:hypothetical protein